MWGRGRRGERRGAAGWRACCRGDLANAQARATCATYGHKGGHTERMD